MERELNTPPGADRRYNYVPFHKLHIDDREDIITNLYDYGVEWIPDHEYWYPVMKDRRLASARRWISAERATELRDQWIVKDVMES